MMETATRSAGKDLKEPPDTRMMEETSNGTITRYIRGLGIISSDSEEAKTYYHYVSDEQGSITHVLSEDAEILNHYSYDAFGNIIEKTEKVENRFCYNGEMLDPVTQQYYLRARFYNPVIGRFTQEDTYYGDGLNLYQYCQANPVGYVDPSGHDCETTQSRYNSDEEQHPKANAAGGYTSATEKGNSKSGSKTNFDNEIPRSGSEWNEYLKGKYGADNVHWNINSVDDIFSDPTRLKGYTVDELQKVLGNDWTRGVYGSNGGGWKLMNGDISIFYHPGGGKHGGSYYGISSGATGKIKVVNPETYIPLKGDKATVIYD